MKSQYSRQAEDCLNLNIWAPPKAKSGSGYPVFVYMYGGAMVTGSNSNPQLQGTNFAHKDVVYVNFNTREHLRLPILLGVATRKPENVPELEHSGC